MYAFFVSKYHSLKIIFPQYFHKHRGINLKYELFSLSGLII